VPVLPVVPVPLVEPVLPVVVVEPVEAVLPVVVVVPVDAVPDVLPLDELVFVLAVEPAVDVSALELLSFFLQLLTSRRKGTSPKAKVNFKISLISFMFFYYLLIRSYLPAGKNSVREFKTNVMPVKFFLLKRKRFNTLALLLITMTLMARAEKKCRRFMSSKMKKIFLRYFPHVETCSHTCCSAYLIISIKDRAFL
jgi:hypothetical protein